MNYLQVVKGAAPPMQAPPTKKRVYSYAVSPDEYFHTKDEVMSMVNTAPGSVYVAKPLTQSNIETVITSDTLVQTAPKESPRGSCVLAELKQLRREKIILDTRDAIYLAREECASLAAAALASRNGVDPTARTEGLDLHEQVNKGTICAINSSYASRVSFLKTNGKTAAAEAMAQELDAVRQGTAGFTTPEIKLFKRMWISLNKLKDGAHPIRNFDALDAWNDELLPSHYSHFVKHGEANAAGTVLEKVYAFIKGPGSAAIQRRIDEDNL